MTRRKGEKSEDLDSQASPVDGNSRYVYAQKTGMRRKYSDDGPRETAPESVKHLEDKSEKYKRPMAG